MIYISDDNWNEDIALNSDHFLVICFKTSESVFFSYLQTYDIQFFFRSDDEKLNLFENELYWSIELRLMRIIFSLRISIINGLKGI